MARYDDDEKGGLFPTRTGAAIGASKERGMLDNIGGSGSFRTQLWNQPDGSTTRLKTKNGMPEFITEPDIKNERDYIDKFFATPSSETYQSGYAPAGTSSPKGPFSEWARWMGKTVAPLNAESLATGAKLKPVRLLDNTVPGSITWYGEGFKINGQLITVSWRGNNSRAGTYGDLGESAISSWTTKPSNIDGFRLEADCATVATDFSPYVWVSDKIRISVGVNVWSAALRKIDGDTFLYVVSGDDIYRAKITLFSAVDGGLVLNKKLSSTPLTMSLVGNFGISDLSQMPFFNQSGTKVVLMRSVKGVSEDPVPSPDWSVAEVDVDSLSVTPVFTNECYHNTPDVTGTYVGDMYTYDTTSTQAAYSDIDYKTAVAADYKDDQLVYVTMRYVRSYSAAGYVHSGTNDGAGTKTFTLTSTAAVTTDSLIVEHSVHGEVFSVDAPGGTVVRSYSGVQDIHGGVYNVDSSLSASGSTLRLEHFPFLISADLRHDYMMFAYRATATVFYGTGTWSHPGNTYGMAPGEDGTYDSMYVAYVGNHKIFSVEHQFADPTSTSTTSWVNGPAPFNSPGAATVAGTHVRYDSGPYSFIMGDTIGGSTTNVCAKVAHITVSPDGKAAYLGLCWMTTDTESGVDEMYFTFIDSNGARVTQKIPASTYAPGAASYLSGGIFYQKVLEFP